MLSTKLFSYHDLNLRINTFLFNILILFEISLFRDFYKRTQNKMNYINIATNQNTRFNKKQLILYL